MSTKPNKLSPKEKERARLFLIADPSSPSGVRWSGHWNKQTSSHLAGKPFGHINSKGYWKGMFSGTRRQAHNLLWFLVYREDPADFYPSTVDHWDQDRSNNSLSNLRLATPRDQALNRGAYRKPNMPLAKSGYRWVYCSIDKSGRQRYAARFSSRKREYRVGTFDSPEEAHLAAVAMRLKLGLPT